MHTFLYLLYVEWFIAVSSAHN